MIWTNGHTEPANSIWSRLQGWIWEESKDAVEWTEFAHCHQPTYWALWGPVEIMSNLVFRELDE